MNIKRTNRERFFVETAKVFYDYGVEYNTWLCLLFAYWQY